MFHSRLPFTPLTSDSWSFNYRLQLLDGQSFDPDSKDTPNSSESRRLRNLNPEVNDVTNLPLLFWKKGPRRLISTFIHGPSQSESSYVSQNTSKTI